MELKNEKRKRYSISDTTKLQEFSILSTLKDYEIYTHAVSGIEDSIYQFCRSCGFNFKNEKEICSTEECFDSLMIAKDHPSRDESGAFYLNDKTMLLRPHTTLFWKSCDFNISKTFFTIGYVYRKDSDKTHTPMFTQCDVVSVDEKFVVDTIKSFLCELIFYLLEKEIRLEFRSSFFPYTHFSNEVFCECFKCNGNTEIQCSVCKNERWIEILGFGIPRGEIIPRSNIYTGLAFGIGLERIAMIKHKIEDIRELYF